MAEIYYLIRYEHQDAFQVEQHISSIGPGVPDKVGFATTQETINYLGGLHPPRIAALKRDHPIRDPFDPAFPNIVVLTLEGTEDDYNVRRQGGKAAFHLTCGTVADVQGHDFQAWDGASVLIPGHRTLYQEEETKHTVHQEPKKMSVGSYAATKPSTGTRVAIEPSTENKPSLPFPG